ncbi:uncharacterized protein LOC135201709 [Macrobrachium nipponense]|uniref:uncharacterized protein LOC135201709 n=1 Tax=Macrobrachium nipponense TaxID=159736 RepID=UPI0030C8A60B
MWRRNPPVSLIPLSLALILPLLPPLAQGNPAAKPDILIPDLGVLLQDTPTREGRHFTTLDFCSDAVCDQMVRQANGLARLKVLRQYVVNALSSMDRLVTALDAELVVAGELLTRSLGNRCRAAHAVLADVTKGPAESDRLNSRSAAFIYGPHILL